jgi:hypothetical protein
LREFVQAHASCAETVVVSPEPPTSRGYNLAARCRGCGGEFECFVTPAAARRDLIFSPLLVSDN